MPGVGELHLDYEAPAIVADPDLTLLVYSASPGSADAERLASLAARADEPGGEAS